MPHYKCSACRVRLELALPADAVGDLCPGCGAVLVPVDDLSEIVGFRSIQRRPGSRSADEPSVYARLAARLGEIRAGSETLL